MGGGGENEGRVKRQKHEKGRKRGEIEGEIEQERNLGAELRHDTNRDPIRATRTLPHLLNTLELARAGWLLTNMRRCRAQARPMQPFWPGPQTTSTVACRFSSEPRGKACGRGGEKAKGEVHPEHRREEERGEGEK